MSQIIEDAFNFLSDVNLLTLPVNPFKLAEKYEINLSEINTQKFDGCIQSIQEKILILINSNIKNQARKNFTCAHELGHFQYDVFKEKIECSENSINYLKPNNLKWNSIEIRANQFAAEILMPTNLLKPLIINKEPSWELFEKLKAKCNVSLPAILTKFIELTNYSCWFVEIKSGKIHRYIKSCISPHNLHIINKMKYSLKTSKDWETCSPYSWFDDDSIPKTAKYEKILYSTYEIKEYDLKYVILWDESGILDEEDENDF